MPRLTKSLPSYRKHKPSGQAVVTLCGRDHYLGRHGTAASKAEYERLLGEWLSSGRDATSAVATSNTATISQVMAEYIRRHVKTHYVKNGKPTSEQATIRCSLKLLRRLYGRTPASDFGPLKLKSLRERMVEDGLARTTVNHYVNLIRRMFRWAASEELVPNEVSAALATVDGLLRGRSKARETEPVGPVCDAAIDAVLPLVRPPVAAMVQLQRLTGMRPGEVTVLRPCDVDRSGEVWVYTPESHKTEHHGSSRKIFIGPRAKEILEPFLGCDRDMVRSCVLRVV